MKKKFLEKNTCICPTVRSRSSRSTPANRSSLAVATARKSADRCSNQPRQYGSVPARSTAHRHGPLLLLPVPVGGFVVVTTASVFSFSSSSSSSAMESGWKAGRAGGSVLLSGWKAGRAGGSVLLSDWLAGVGRDEDTSFPVWSIIWPEKKGNDCSGSKLDIRAYSDFELFGKFDMLQMIRLPSLQKSINLKCWTVSIWFYLLSYKKNNTSPCGSWHFLFQNCPESEAKKAKVWVGIKKVHNSCVRRWQKKVSHRN